MKNIKKLFLYRLDFLIIPLKNTMDIKLYMKLQQNLELNFQGRINLVTYWLIEKFMQNLQYF